MGGVRGTGPSVDVKSRIVCWCVCVGVGIGGKDGPAPFDLGGAACCCEALVFWCRSGAAPGLPRERLSDSEWGFGREAVSRYAVLRAASLFISCSEWPQRSVGPLDGK
jgi:hypothetical protein